MLSRWICALYLHISQSEEVETAFQMMKYTLNHPWKFENWWAAFNVGLFQFGVLVLVEFVSMMVLLLQFNVLDVLMNFLALTIITEFDDQLFTTLHDDPIRNLIKEKKGKFCGIKRKIEDIIVIQTTTSWYARFRIDENRFGLMPPDEEDDGKKPRPVNNRTSARASRASWNKNAKSVFKNDEEPEYIYIPFRHRSWLNMLCRIIY